MSLTRDQILKHVALPAGEVDVPELGGKVRIAGLSVAAADGIRALTEGENADVPFNVRVVIVFACDEKNEPIFTMDDVPALKRLPQAAINTIANKALDLNGLSEKSKAELGNASEADGIDDSGSASPSLLDEPSPN